MKFALRGLLTSCVLLSTLTLEVSQAQQPVSTTASPQPQPQIFYDRADVLKLINSIEDSKSRERLINYFNYDRPKVLPKTEGLQLLKAAIAAEKVGTKRWLYLQKVLGIAGLKPNWAGTERQQGFTAYEEVLAQQDSLIKSGLGPLLGETVADFLNAIGHPEFNRGIEDGAKSVFPKAFAAHLTLLRKGIYTSLQVDWLPAVMGYPDPLLRPWAEAAVADPANKNSFGILRFAALIHEPLRPEQALPILENIKPLAAEQPRDQAIWYYRSWVNVLERLNRIPEAKTKAEEMVKATNAGRDLQIALLLKTNDLDSMPSLVEQYKKSVISDEDVTPLIRALWNPTVERIPTNDRDQWGIEILSSYLASKNKRNLESEFQAIRRLSSLYKKAGRIAEARTLLVTALQHPEPVENSSRVLYRLMQLQLSLLDKPASE